LVYPKETKVKMFWCATELSRIPGFHFEKAKRNRVPFRQLPPGQSRDRHVYS
jgi:hypothetical protein